MDGFDGLQDLFAQSQGGAHGEGSPRLTPPQVGQVPALRRQQRGNMFDKEHQLSWSKRSSQLPSDKNRCSY